MFVQRSFDDENQNPHEVDRLRNLLRQYRRRRVQCPLSIFNRDRSMINEENDNRMKISIKEQRRVYLSFSSSKQCREMRKSTLNRIETICPLVKCNRRCSSRVFLIDLIEQRPIALDFLPCDNDQPGSIDQDEAERFSRILRRSCRFSLSPNEFDHLRRILIFKSLIEVTGENDFYLKELNNFKEEFLHRTKIYYQLFLFLSSLYSIADEIIETLFGQSA